MKQLSSIYNPIQAKFLSKKKIFNIVKEKKKRKNLIYKLGQKFIKYISRLKTDKLNINDVVKALNIKEKRRIYDITNVLEGKLY